MSPLSGSSESSDQQLVALALDGDQTAWTEIVERYTLRVYQLIRAIVGTHERAKDLTQDTLITVFEKLHRYRPELPFKPWVMRIAHNIAIDYVEEHRPLDSATDPNALPLHLFDQGELALPSAEHAPTPDPVAPYRRALRRAMRQLKPIQRQCLELRIRHGLKYGEIAEKLGLPVGTVKSHVNRATKKLLKLASQPGPSDLTSTPA